MRVNRPDRITCCAALATLVLVGAASPVHTASFMSGLDPSPYEQVRDAVVCRTLAPRILAFALLGYEREPQARVIAAYESTSAGWHRLYLDHDRGFHPWSIQLAELDGDSLPEVGVGVTKKSRFDPVSRRRLFIFDWTEQDRLTPKWLGSRLAFPFDSFMFHPTGKGRTGLTTTGPSGTPAGRHLNYRWNGFGFSFVDSAHSTRGDSE